MRGRIEGPHLDADDLPGRVCQRYVHYVDVPFTSRLTGVGAGYDAIAGERPHEVGLRGLAVNGHCLVVGKTAAEGDLDAVQCLHVRGVSTIESRVTQLAVERENRQATRRDIPRQRLGIARHRSRLLSQTIEI